MNCKDCMYWIKSTDSQAENILFECKCPKFRKGYHLSADEIGRDEVWVEDDEGWGFFPGELFGCIHFAQKNKPTSK